MDTSPYGLDWITRLTDMGLLAVQGADAVSFLHGQLTNDVAHLGAQDVRLAGYCSPKGRLLATMLLWKTQECVYLQLPRALLPAVQKRLTMFVMRAKVTLTDVTTQHALLGVCGESVKEVCARWFPVIPTQPYHQVESDYGTLLRVADVPIGEGLMQARYQWITTTEIAEQAWPDLTQHLTATHASTWHLTDIRAGIAQITPATQEQFVPQMINYDLVGGVNFKKGCYPGQEVVARTHYLGKLKRRTLLAMVDVANVVNASDESADGVLPGREIFSSNDPHQPCGMMVNAEVSASEGSRRTYTCLVEIKLAVLEDSDACVCLGSVDGPPLQFLSLPYVVVGSE